MLGIETKLLTFFHPQTDSQTEHKSETRAISTVLYRS